VSQAQYGSSSRAALQVVFWLAFALPALGDPYVVEKAAMGALALGCVLLLASSKRMPASYFERRLTPIIVPLVVVSFTYSLSYFAALWGADVQTGLRDLMELIRYPLWVIFVLTLLAFRRQVGAEWIVRRLVVPSIYFSVACFVLYVLPVPFLSALLRYVYSGTKTAIGFDTGWLSWSIPFENPNFLGLYLNWALVALLFFSKKTRTAPIAVTLLLIFATGSRTAWLACLCALAAWVVASALSPGRRRRAVWLFLAAGGILCLAAVLSPVRFDEMTRVERVTTAIQKGSVLLEPSLAAHLVHANTLLSDVWAAHPILGVGPSKYAVADVIDNQYVTWLVRTGVVGTLCLLLTVTTLILWRPMRAFLAIQDRFHAVGVVAFTVATGLSLFTGAFLDNLRLLVLGLTIGLCIVANPNAADVGPS